MVRRACTNALLEPGDTKKQWKGEAAACFVSAGITSSRMLPTSSVGYWPPSFNLCNASASEEKRSFGGEFFCQIPNSSAITRSPRHEEGIGGREDGISMW